MRSFDESRKRIAEIERRWKAELGAERWAALSDALRALSPGLPDDRG